MLSRFLFTATILLMFHDTAWSEIGNDLITLTQECGGEIAHEYDTCLDSGPGRFQYECDLYNNDLVDKCGPSFVQRMKIRLWQNRRARSQHVAIFEADYAICLTSEGTIDLSQPTGFIALEDQLKVKTRKVRGRLRQKTFSPKATGSHAVSQENLFSLGLSFGVKDHYPIKATYKGFNVRLDGNCYRFR